MSWCTSQISHATCRRKELIFRSDGHQERSLCSRSPILVSLINKLAGKRSLLSAVAARSERQCCAGAGERSLLRSGCFEKRSLCKTLQDPAVHRESYLRSYATAGRYHAHLVLHHRRGLPYPDERVRSRLETFSPINPAAFPCYKYVAPDPPFVIESHKMLVFRPVRDLHYLQRTSNLVSHPGPS